MRLDLVEPDDLPVVVGRYQLVSLLGEGGMARVFRAEMTGDLGFRKPAAVKVVLPARGEKAAELRQQLIQEARVGALLNHPNVVQTFDCGELEGFPYIAMELVEGVGLGKLVERAGPLAPPVAIEIAVQVLRGLHHAHTAKHDGKLLQIIHRDVKPSNILIRGDGLVKVVDFGIAKASVADAQLTASGMTKGTPAYMSPEQLGAEVLDPRSDLFTTGAVLWFMLTGRTLFGGASLTEVMMRIVQVEETLERAGAVAIADRLAPGLGDAFAQMLAKLPENRFPTAADAAEALAAIHTVLDAPDRSLAELVNAHFADRLGGGAVGPHPKNWAATPGVPIAKPLGAGAAAVPPTLAMAAPESTPGPTRHFPAGPSDPAAPETVPDLLPGGAIPDHTPTVQEWPFDPDAEDQVVEVPLSTQSRPGFVMPATQVRPPPPHDPSPAPAPGGAQRTRQTRRMHAQASAIQQQRRLLLVLGAVVGAMAVLLGFFGFQAIQEQRTRPPERLAEATPTPVVEPTPEPSTPRAQPTPRPKPRTTPTPRPKPRATPAPSREPTPTPVVKPPAPTPAPTPAPPPEATPEPVGPPPDLKLKHKPIQRAAIGSQKFVEVTSSVVDGTRMSLFYGPPDGPYESKPMRHVGENIFRCTLQFPATGKLDYWIVARNAKTEPTRTLDGSRFQPHTVQVY